MDKPTAGTHPEIALQSANITTLYPGASPEEVEKLVTAPIEEAIEENVSKSICCSLTLRKAGRLSLLILKR